MNTNSLANSTTDDKLFSTQGNLNTQHYKECVEKRGLAPEWVQANCRSVTSQEASDLLGYTAQSDGIWLERDNRQGQYKPDKPWLSEKDKAEGKKKAPKYRSALGEYDAMLPTHPSNPQYWTDIEALKQKAYKINGHPCLVLTEGFFKAIAGCSNGFPTIALLGVEMGLTPKDDDPQGKRYLVPTLEYYAKAGFGFIIGFDADCATNDNVIQAQRKLSHQLLKFKVPVYSVTGLWTEEHGKGMDDYIQKNGADTFITEVLRKAIAIESWEKQFQENPSKKGRIPKADILGAEIAEDFRNKLIFNSETNHWMVYELEYSGVWTAINNEFSESIIDRELEARGIRGYGSNSYLTNVLAKMRNRLIARQWDEVSPKDYLPFQNQVVEITTGKPLSHAPGHKFTWQLPRNYDNSSKDFYAIERFLNEATDNNSAIKNVLYCFLNAIIKGRSDLHQFLHLIGDGGTGKSTFINLAVMVIGMGNVRSTSLSDFCGNRFESSNCYKKRLVIFPDQGKYTGDLQKFRSLTGQDLINAEDKGKKGFQYKYDGMVIVASNDAIFVGNNSSWLKRRLILVPFNHRVDKDKCRNLEDEFKPELNALTNYLLTIPDEEVTRVLKNAVDNIPEVAEQVMEQWILTDSIAAWINERVIHDPIAKTPIGSDKTDTTTLFGNYFQYCSDAGKIGKSSTQFSSDLIRFCNSILGWANVKKSTRTNKGYCIYGLKLRDPDEDDDSPYPLETVELEQLSLEMPIEKNALEKIPLNPTHPTQVLPSKEFNPTLDPTQCRVVQPYTSTHPTLEDEVPAIASQPTQLESVGSVGSSSLHCVGLSVESKPASSKESVGCVGLEPLPAVIQLVTSELTNSDVELNKPELEQSTRTPDTTAASPDPVAIAPKFEVGQGVAMDEDRAIRFQITSSRFDASENCFMYETRPSLGTCREDRLMDFEQARSRHELDF